MGYTWTVKDFGTFKKFLTYRRLRGLLKYFDSQEIPYSILSQELKEYDKYRKKFLMLFFYLEKAIVEKDRLGLKALAGNKEFNQVQFDVYINWIKNQGISFKEQFLTEVRNRFSHSEFPEQSITQIPGITQKEQEDFDMNCEKKGHKENHISLSKRIFEKYDQEISDITGKIKALEVKI